MKTVILHPEAEAEFENAADYYEAQRTGYGEIFRQEVADALSQIGSTPKCSHPTRAGRYAGD